MNATGQVITIVLILLALASAYAVAHNRLPPY